MSNSDSTDNLVYPVKKDVAREFLIDKQTYSKMYKQSVDNNEEFWADQAGMLDWTKPFSTVKDVSFEKDDLHIRWFEDLSLIHI